MTIRPLHDLKEFEQCVELQREAWGLADIDMIPLRMFVTQNRIGGLILGAFEDDQFIGFLSAMPGIRHGKPYWYSQMLAVKDSYRNRGVGSDLKLAQRDRARELGIQLIEWTFDPLESKNAYLNIAKLGVIVRRYYVNLYGATSSQMQKGLESDRIIAEWWVDKPRISVQTSGEGEVRRISIPCDIQALKHENPVAAQDVQMRVRYQFLKNFQDDYYVAGFERHDDSSEYLFIHGASRVHQTD